MLRLIQVYKQVEDKEFFINIFNDLEFELDELGYRDFPEDLMEDLLFNHFGLSFECSKQLAGFTQDVLKKQNKMSFLRMLP